MTRHDPLQDSGLRRALAPDGALRATINPGNPMRARISDDGAPTGVSVDLATDLAARLGVPLRLRVVDGAARAVAAVAAEEADVGFFAIDPARAQGLHSRALTS